MNEITIPVYQRQIADVTRDIHIQTGQFLRTAIEIGRLLFEAKAMVEPGGWSKYIEEELPFSHSWANNYMKLYKEYGSDQTSLFGDSQAFMNLRPTQALELLALPSAEREAFVESHNVEDMSTRQLRQAVQAELEEERRRHDETRGDLESAQAQLRDTQQNVLDMQQQLSAAKSSEGAWQEQIKKLNAEKHLAETSEKNALKKVEVLENQLKDARKKEKSVRAELKKAQDNPNIPESMMEQLRKEAEAAAAEKNTGDIQKQLDAAKAALADAEAKAQETEEKLVAAQKRLKMADPAIMEYDTLAQKLIADYNVMDGLRRKISVGEKEVGEKLLAFQKKMVSMWEAALEGK